MAATLPNFQLTPVDWPGFQDGLNLRDQPDGVNPTQAIDLLNVTFDQRAGLRSRDGYAKFTAAPLTNQPDSMAAFYTVGGTQQLVVGNGNRLDAVNTAGSSIANAAPTANPHYFARFGGPTTELLFMTNGTDALRQWDGAAFSTPAITGTSPTGRFVAVTPWDNRLVNARRGGATTGDNPSTVRFSDPGAPTTWGANNFVDVTPGDGEAITGIATWSRYLFVFKETKFFRFYGTGTSGTGTPIFSYEGISNDVGLIAPRAIAAARDGLYFLSQKGVYKTTGSDAQLVSPLLDPFFYGSAPDFFTLSQAANQGSLQNAAMAYHRELIYVAVPTGTSTSNNRLLVYDPRYQWWSIYDIPAAALCTLKVSSLPDLVFGYAAGTKDVGRHAAGQATDAGTTIASRWRSGWSDWGIPRRKTVRESLVWGKGRMRVGLGVDFASPTTTAALDFNVSADLWGSGAGPDKWGAGTDPTDLWGSGLLLKPLMNRKSARGTMFSLDIQNTDATPWAVYRLTHRLRQNAGGRPY